MARRRRRKPLPSDPVEVRIDDLSHDGRGVARVDGKATFIHGALPGERLRFRYTGQRRDFDEGEAIEILEPSADRVDPRCAHAEVCGGCVLQHLAPEAQIRHKARTLAENLRRIGRVEPERTLEPLTASPWGYRRRARLSARFVRKKGRVLVGFRERGAPFVVDGQECHILDPEVGFRIAELGSLLDRLDGKRDIPQIEVATGDEATVLVIRHMRPLSEGDLDLLRTFSERTGLGIMLQPGGPKSLESLTAEGRLTFGLSPDLTLAFTPTNFVQVNAALNQKMVELALGLLDLEPDHRVLDLFCGLGNFTLPLARRVGRVVGIEGDDELVELARRNAAANGIDNAEFRVADLTEPVDLGSFDRVLLDPPRSGAQEVLPAVAALGAGRIVYVSCHPGTLARDAGLLVHEHGYRLLDAGVMDMFPHTAHVESMAVFEKKGS